MIKFGFILILLSFSIYSKIKEQIAVLPFTSRGLEEKELFTLEESLRKALTESEKYSVMERSALEKKVESEGIKNLNSCDELECALVFGELLSLNYVIQGRLNKIENTYTFSIRLIDIKKEVILDDITELFTGNFESFLKKIVPRLSKKIQRIRIHKWKVEKTDVKKIDKAKVEREKAVLKKQKVSFVSTSTTLAPDFELENEIDESELTVSPPEEIPGKKKKAQKIVRDELTEKPKAPVTEELIESSVSPASTSTTLVRKVEPEKRKEVVQKTITEEHASSVPPESTTLEVSLQLDKADSAKSPSFLTSEASEETKTISEPKKIVKELKKDSTIVQQELQQEHYSDSAIEDEKEVESFASEMQTELPFTRTFGEMTNELVSDENKKIEPDTSSTIDENSDKKSDKKRGVSRKRVRKSISDQGDMAVSTSPINSDFLQGSSKKNNFINNDSEVDSFSEDTSVFPALVTDAEKESEKSTQSKENFYTPDDTDKTLIADIENEDPMNINDLQEKGSKTRRRAVIITSGISAAVAVPVFLFLFSKKDEKESSTFSLTVEWP